MTIHTAIRRARAACEAMRPADVEGMTDSDLADVERTTKARIEDHVRRAVFNAWLLYGGPPPVRFRLVFANGRREATR